MLAALAIASTSSAVMSVSSTSTFAMRYGTERERDPVRRRVRAHGRVQGVFFRDSVRREAARRGVAGWARNCSDGTAEAVFEGAPDAVAAMVDFVRARARGMPRWRGWRSPREALRDRAALRGSV